MQQRTHKGRLFKVISQTKKPTICSLYINGCEFAGSGNFYYFPSKISHTPNSHAIQKFEALWKMKVEHDFDHKYLMNIINVFNILFYSTL